MKKDSRLDKQASKHPFNYSKTDALNHPEKYLIGLGLTDKTIKKLASLGGEDIEQKPLMLLTDELYDVVDWANIKHVKPVVDFLEGNIDDVVVLAKNLHPGAIRTFMWYFAWYEPEKSKAAISVLNKNLANINSIFETLKDRNEDGIRNAAFQPATTIFSATYDQPKKLEQTVNKMAKFYLT